MLISFECPECETELEIDAEEGGARLECPACGGIVRVPIPRVGPGTTLGNFRIEKQLGSGGMGEVFLATQVSMERQVALKVLPQAMTRNKTIVERFLHEVRMSARLEHPNIVTAFEAGEDNGYYYLAMSYIDGEDLGVRLGRNGPIPEQEALKYAQQVASALGYAWDRFKILHRDIKPGNIMIDRSGAAKLMDLGISKSVADADASLTIPGMVIGTPYYMSPEQARSGTQLDFRSDMYALGATMYHLVTGTAPYTGDGTVAILTSHATDPFPMPRERNPNVSHICGHLLHCMMAKSCEERYGTWDALIRDIERVLKGLQPQQPRPKDTTVTGSAAPPTPEKLPAKAVAAAVPRSTKKKEEVPPVLNAEGALRRLMRTRRMRRIAVVLGIPFTIIVAFIAASLFKARSSSIRVVEGQPAHERGGLVSSGGATAAGNAGIAKPASDLDIDVESFVADTTALDHFLDKAVDDIMAGRFDSLRERLLNAQADPKFQDFVPQLNALSLMLRNLRMINRHIEDSFRRQIGEQITVGLRSGSVTLVVRNVTAGVITGMRIGRHPDTRPRRLEFSPADLTVDERMQRLEDYSRRPGVALSLGMMHLRRGEFSAAHDSFITLPAEIREACLRKVVTLEKEKGATELKVE